MISSAEYKVLLEIFTCLVSGILIKYSLLAAKQKWINNFQSTLTCVLLPIITFIITKVISNNIALSLGMVGALSIIRFRNPVKNTLEIVVYFALITIGIATAVNIKYSITLSIVFSLSVLIVYFSNLIFKSNWIFSTSYVEGENGHFLEIEKKTRFKEIEKKEELIETFYNSEDKIYCYKLFFKEKNKAILFYEKFINQSDIINIKLYND